MAILCGTLWVASCMSKLLSMEGTYEAGSPVVKHISRPTPVHTTGQDDGHFIRVSCAALPPSCPLLQAGACHPAELVHGHLSPRPLQDEITA